MYYNIKKHKDFFYLNLFVYLIPFTIILGNLAINILSTICVILFIVNILNIKILFIFFFYFQYFI